MRAARTLAGLALAGLAAASPPAGATVCLVTTSVLAFGIYDSLLPTSDDTTATITVTCTPEIGSPLRTDYTLTLAGTGVAGDTVRSASSGSQRVYYQVYKDAGRTTVWGNGSTSGSGVSGSVVSAATGLPASQTHVAYARLPARQRSAPGLYLGSLVVTVDY